MPRHHAEAMKHVPYHALLGSLVHQRINRRVHSGVNLERGIDQQEGLGQHVPLLVGQPLHLPVVDESQLGWTDRVDVQDVARVRVRVEAAVDQHLVPSDGKQIVDELGRVDRHQRVIPLQVEPRPAQTHHAHRPIIQPAVAAGPRPFRLLHGDVTVVRVHAELSDQPALRGRLPRLRLHPRLLRLEELRFAHAALPREELCLRVERLVQRRAREDLLHHQHALGAERLVDARDEHIGELAAPPQVVAHLHCVGALAPVVKLGGELPLDFVKRGGHLRRKDVHDHLEREDVAAEGALSLRVLHLDHHALARRAQDSAVRLPNGSASDGRLVKLAEQALERLPQLALDDLPDLRRRTRRDPVEEGLEHVHVVLGHLRRGAKLGRQRTIARLAAAQCVGRLGGRDEGCAPRPQCWRRSSGPTCNRTRRAP
eukprot:scaffold2601_cov117-Isochrysis_galbana.AAC.4